MKYASREPEMSVIPRPRPTNPRMIRLRAADFLHLVFSRIEQH